MLYLYYQQKNKKYGLEEKDFNKTIDLFLSHAKKHKILVKMMYICWKGNNLTKEEFIKYMKVYYRDFVLIKENNVPYLYYQPTNKKFNLEEKYNEAIKFFFANSKKHKICTKIMHYIWKHGKSKKENMIKFLEAYYEDFVLIEE